MQQCSILNLKLYFCHQDDKELFDNQDVYKRQLHIHIIALVCRVQACLHLIHIIIQQY